MLQRLLLPHLLIILCSLISCSASDPHFAEPNPNYLQDKYIKCLESFPNLSTPIKASQFCTPQNNTFTNVITTTANNLRYTKPSLPKPILILSPTTESQVQAAILCAKRLKIHFILCAGGHDYEALSYVSLYEYPFIVIKLSNLRNVTVDLKTKTAIVQTGASIGEVYYYIAKESRFFAFPAGLCTSIGVGGHLPGGAYGAMMRKFGLGVDNVVDAKIVDANGVIRDRKSMGEDLFWAIRGGAGGSFAAILEWTLKLVPVPYNVTVFTVTKTLEDGLTKILKKWQNVAPKMEDELFIRVLIKPQKMLSNPNQRTIGGSFNALFLGGKHQLIQIMEKSFPELGLTAENCTEMSWIESTLYIGGYPAKTPLETLLQGKFLFQNYYKAKSDYVRKPIPESALNTLWKMMLTEESPLMIWNPYGGMMARIAEGETPFPHREGVLFKIQYVNSWNNAAASSERRHMEWMRKIYGYMAQFVTNKPREAYVNYRDLDLGMNGKDFDAIEAMKWGTSYFKNNFFKLMKIKAVVDPENLFRHAQSIPLLRKMKTNATIDGVV